MSTPHADPSRSLALLGARLLLVGLVLSAPVSLALIALTHPQPAWKDVATFVAHFHAVQTIPYATGLLLIFGFCAAIAGLCANAAPAQRARANLAMLCTAIYATLVGTNYLLQIGVVSTLVHGDAEPQRVLLPLLSMSHPGSLAWSLEMWGYGYVGVATWLVHDFIPPPRSRWASRLLIANGVTSVIGTACTAVAPGWELGLAGGLAGAAWNVLAFAMAFCLHRALRDASPAAAQAA